LVVIAAVAQELAFEVLDQGEDAAGDDIAFDLREREFDLIEPQEIGQSG
jgi:hypothetical protein